GTVPSRSSTWTDWPSLIPSTPTCTGSSFACCWNPAGAARRCVAIPPSGPELDRLGHRDWLIVEQADHAGGLASSVLDPAGFTWDMGGHVVFSHFGEFDALLAEAMGEDVLDHDR